MPSATPCECYIMTRPKEHHGAIAFLIEVDMVVRRRFAVADFREVGRSLARQAPPVSDIQQHLSADRAHCHITEVDRYFEATNRHIEQHQ